jgi:tetraacyldisaccharide 4'-kinase
MLVFGSLRAGGGFKTSLTLKCVQELESAGYKVAVLAYDIKPQHLFSQTRRANKDPNYSGDEGAMLSRNLQSDVWLSQNRDKAWQLLDSMDYDIIISDGGLEDSRLIHAKKILIDSGSLPNFYSDLLPFGAFRSFLKDHQPDFVLYFTRQHPATQNEFGFATAPESAKLNQLRQAKVPFRLITAIGNPANLLTDINNLGIQLSGQKILRDHDPKFPQKIENNLKQHPNAYFICTPKDAIKCSTELLSHPRVLVLKRELILGESNSFIALLKGIFGDAFIKKSGTCPN